MGGLVVGVDGSDGSRAALAWAVRETQLWGDGLAVIMVLSRAPVIPAEGGSVAALDRDRVDEVTLRRGEVLLSGMVAPYADSGVAITTRVVRDGMTYQALLEAGVDADTLIVGSRGLGTYRRLLLGSVSHQVVVHAETTVVVVPEPPTDGRGGAKVVVGIDGSAAARIALRRAAAEAKLRDCELELVLVQPAPPVAGDRSSAQLAIDAYLWTGALPPITTRPDSAAEWNREQVVAHWHNAAEAQLADELATVGPDERPARVTTSVIGGHHAAGALLDAAARAELLVVGRSGHGGFTGMLLGSVAQHCVRHATSPVMVVAASDSA